MSTHNLDKIFKPERIAVIGASGAAGSLLNIESASTKVPGRTPTKVGVIIDHQQFDLRRLTQCHVPIVRTGIHFRIHDQPCANPRISCDSAHAVRLERITASGNSAVQGQD